MVSQACPTNPNGIVGGTRPPAFFGELRKSDRRRIRLDPASQFENPWTIGGHDFDYGTTVTCFEIVAVRPALSVTVSVMTLVPLVL